MSSQTTVTYAIQRRNTLEPYWKNVSPEWHTEEDATRLLADMVSLAPLRDKATRYRLVKQTVEIESLIGPVGPGWFLPGDYVLVENPSYDTHHQAGTVVDVTDTSVPYRVLLDGEYDARCYHHTDLIEWGYPLDDPKGNVTR